MPTYPDTLALREDCRIGDIRTIGLRLYHSTATNAASQLAPSTAWFLGIDPARTTVLTVTSGGVARFKAATSGASNLWKSCPAEITKSGRTYQVECTGYTSGAATGLWTINPLQVAVTSGTVKFTGYPVLARTSATISGAKCSIAVRPSGANTYTAQGGERRLVLAYKLTTSDWRRQPCAHTIRPIW